MSLEIVNLVASTSERKTPILQGLSLNIPVGEVHVIMGPNGAGKSTLTKVLSGHPDYHIEEGSIFLNGKDLSSLEPHERVHAGLFVGFQYPVEIPGVNNLTFLHIAVNSVRKARGESEFSLSDFTIYLKEKLALISMREEFVERPLNEGFSGGEKKRNEVLQMMLLDPKIAILDETDSGLDIDALKIVAEGINRFRSSEKGILLITHYQRILDFVVPDRIHVMLEGRIVHSGDASLAVELEKRGYDWLATAQK